MAMFKMFPDLQEVMFPIAAGEARVLAQYIAAVESAGKERGAKKKVADSIGTSIGYINGVIYKELVEKGFIKKMKTEGGGSSVYKVYGATRNVVEMAAKILGRDDILQELETRRIRHEKFHETSIPAPTEHDPDALNILSLDRLAENLSILETQARSLLRDCDALAAIVEENKRKLDEEELSIEERNALKDENRELIEMVHNSRANGIPVLNKVVTQQISGRSKFQEEIDGMVKDIESLSDIDIIDTLLSVTSSMWGSKTAEDIKAVLIKHKVMEV